MTRRTKLWGGRFATHTDPLVERFTASISIDYRLAKHDVMGSIAHAKMLGSCGIIPARQAQRLVRGLSQIARRIDQGRWTLDPKAEDIHTQIYRELRALVGSTADRLQTARSRNDQIALDVRLWCREVVQQTQRNITALQHALVEFADRYVDVVIPGYTHLQRAQPVLLAHHILAYVEMLERDHQRLSDCQKRINVMPLGSGALAGSSLPIHRRQVAKLLGFPDVTGNSVDAVSDRDFAAELLADLAIVAVHLSRFAEDLILWATEEFGIMTLDDAFATGSSLMPQKKNPDVLELIRGQAGLAIGQLVALLTILKGLPLAYNRDLQWDKTALMPLAEQIHASLTILTRLIRHVRIRRERIGTLLDATLCATDVAEQLVRRGQPFRHAHEVVGRLIRYTERTGRRLDRLTRAELRKLAPELQGDVRKLWDPRQAILRTCSEGGTGPRQVRQALQRWRTSLRTRGRRHA